MEVILHEDVPGLGIMGDIVKVKAGYARNYLLPRGIAAVADRRSVKALEHQRRIVEAKKTKERDDVEQRAKALEGTVLETEARAGKGGRLFGSVTSNDIAGLLAARGVNVDRRQIELAEPVKQIGRFEVKVRVGQDVHATITVEVKPLGGQLEIEEQDEVEVPAEAEVSGETEVSAEAVVEQGEEVAGKGDGETPESPRVTDDGEAGGDEGEPETDDSE